MPRSDEKLTRAEYDELVQLGFSREEIQAAGYTIPRRLQPYCWRCGTEYVKVYGAPCATCQAAIMLEYEQLSQGRPVYLLDSRDLPERTVRLAPPEPESVADQLVEWWQTCPERCGMSPRDL